MEQVPILKLLRGHAPSEAVSRKLDYHVIKPFEPGIDFAHTEPEALGDYALLFVMMASVLMFFAIYLFDVFL
jgi:hypothetical protein